MTIEAQLHQYKTWIEGDKITQSHQPDEKDKQYYQGKIDALQHVIDNLERSQKPYKK